MKVFLFYQCFLSWTFTIHRTVGERGGHLFNSFLPLPPALHLDISRVITAESSPLQIASSWTRTGNLWFWHLDNFNRKFFFFLLCAWWSRSSIEMKSKGARCSREVSKHHFFLYAVVYLLMPALAKTCSKFKTDSKYIYI